MKTDIHPKNYRPVVFQDTNNNKMFLISSCVDTTETVKYEGAEYPLYKTEISSASHPFYTGEKITVDTAGRIEKFQAQQKAAAARKEEIEKRGTKKRRTNSFEDKVNLELQKQLSEDQKKEDKLMAKIRKNRPAEETANEAPAEEAEKTEDVVEATEEVADAAEETAEEVVEETTEEVAEATEEAPAANEEVAEEVAEDTQEEAA
jgi:large subunit ribosomal protein L31